MKFQSILQTLYLHPLYFLRTHGKKYKGFLSYLYNVGLIYYCETVICINNDNEFPEKKKKEKETFELSFK